MKLKFFPDIFLTENISLQLRFLTLTVFCLLNEAGAIAVVLKGDKMPIQKIS